MILIRDPGFNTSISYRLAGFLCQGDRFVLLVGRLRSFVDPLMISGRKSKRGNLACQAFFSMPRPYHQSTSGPQYRTTVKTAPVLAYVSSCVSRFTWGKDRGRRYEKAGLRCLLLFYLSLTLPLISHSWMTK